MPFFILGTPISKLKLELFFLIILIMVIFGIKQWEKENRWKGIMKDGSKINFGIFALD